MEKLLSVRKSCVRRGSLGFKMGVGATSAIISSLADAKQVCQFRNRRCRSAGIARTMIMNIYAYGTLMIWVIAVIVLFLYQLDKRYPEILEKN